MKIIVKKRTAQEIIFVLAVAVLISGGVVIIAPFLESGSRAKTISVKEKEISIIETSMNELEEMGLLDLIDLKEKIIDFKNLKTDFEIDVSGILDVLF